MKYRHPGCIRFLSVLVSIAVTALLIEHVLLRQIDPLGIYRRAVDNQKLFALTVPSPDGLRFEAGDYQFRTYHAVIGDDGFRTVPNSRGGNCTIAFIGDSVTWGYGSSATFVNLLAPDIPARVINAGIPGYGIGNIRRVVDGVPADGYVYTIIENDGQAAEEYWRANAADLPPAWRLYFEWRGGQIIVDPAAFRAQAVDLLAREDVLAFAFSGRGMTDEIRREFPQVKIIPYWTHNVSWADGHPNESGHAEITNSMKDAVIEFAGRRCLP